MGKIDLLRHLITYETGSRLAVKGGVKAQKQLISAAAEDLRTFLSPYKGKRISI